MTRYLLDTNTVSNLIKRPAGLVAQRIAEVGERNVMTSIIVVAALRYGVVKKKSPPLAAQADAVLSAMDILPFAHPAEDYYASVRAELESRGRPIGANDLMIAAHALALGCTLVTDNLREFSRVDSLTVENWLR